MNKPGIDGAEFKITLVEPTLWSTGDLLRVRTQDLIITKIYWNWWRKILHRLGFKTKLFEAKVERYGI